MTVEIQLNWLMRIIISLNKKLYKKYIFFIIIIVHSPLKTEIDYLIRNNVPITLCNSAEWTSDDDCCFDIEIDHYREICNRHSSCILKFQVKNCYHKLVAMRYIDANWKWCKWCWVVSYRVFLICLYSYWFLNNNDNANIESIDSIFYL